MIMQTIPDDYCGRRFSMNPETEDIIRGSDLENGMVVLVESRDLRLPTSNERLDNREDILPQIVDVDRWCRITNLCQDDWPNGKVSFVGVYSDGKKAFREYQAKTAWFVKLDSMPEAEVEGLYIPGSTLTAGMTLDAARTAGFIRPIRPQVIPAPLGPLVIFPDAPMEMDLEEDLPDIPPVFLPHPDDTDVYPVDSKLDEDDMKKD
jgi:hypothetical protein